MYHAHIIKSASRALDGVMGSPYRPAPNSRKFGHEPPREEGAREDISAREGIHVHAAGTKWTRAHPKQTAQQHANEHRAKPTSANLAVRSLESSTLRDFTSKCVYEEVWR